MAGEIIRVSSFTPNLPIGRKLLVTGGAGFVGFEVVTKLLESGFSVHVVDSILELVYPENGRRERLEAVSHRNFSYQISNALELSESDLDGMDGVVNLAAAPGLLPSWENFQEYSSNNLGVVGHLAQLCSNRELPLIHASTSSVFGERALPGGGKFPNSPYGLTKYAAEQTIELFAASRGLKYSILRLFSVYGPNQRPDQFYRKVVEKLVAGSVIGVTGDGSQTRSNAYLSDVAGAFVRAANRDPLNDSVDIAGGEQFSVIEVIYMIAKVLGVDPKLVFIGARLGDQKETIGDLSKTKKLLDWSPSMKFEEGIRRMIDSLV